MLPEKEKNESKWKTNFFAIKQRAGIFYLFEIMHLIDRNFLTQRTVVGIIIKNKYLYKMHIFSIIMQEKDFRCWAESA